MMKRAFIIGKPSAQHGRIALICLSEAFYLKLAMAGCNCVVLRLLRQLVMHTSLIVGLFVDTSQSTCPDDEHLMILNVIRTGDAAQAEWLMVAHLEHLRQGLDMRVRKLARHDLDAVLGGN